MSICRPVVDQDNRKGETRVRFTNQDKLDLINMMEAGVSVPELALQWNCGESTLYRIKRDKEIIKAKLKDSAKSLLHKKSFFECKGPTYQ